MLRHVLSVGVLVGLAGLCATSSGCTALLGDFEVSGDGTSSGTLPDGGSSSGGDGSTSEDGGPPGNPAPELLAKPRTPTGWRDSANAPIAFEMKPTGVPGTIYECRSGPEGKQGGPPPFAPCDGKQGAEPKHFPQSDPAIPEGTYRFEYRYRIGEYTSPVLGYRFYTLFKLDKVATCPRPGFPDDGPRYTDADYFAAADKWSKENVGQFPIDATFPAPTQDRKTSPVWLENPFIRVTFANIETSTGMKRETRSPATWNWPNKGEQYVVNERSLRHQWLTDPARRMMIYKRQYARPNVPANAPNACANTLEVGSSLGRRRGPVPRGPRPIDCEAWVFNSKGQALCMTTRSGTTTPQVSPIDLRPGTPTAGPGGLRLSTTQENSSVLQRSSASFDLMTVFGYPGTFVQPTDLYVFIESSAVDTNNTDPDDYNDYKDYARRWYKVNTLYPQYVYVDAVTWHPSKKQYVSGCLAGCTFQFYKGPLVPRFVVPTGYAKLHERKDHAYSLGLRNTPFNTPGTPSPTTKCETAGCNAGNYGFLTFLPP